MVKAIYNVLSEIIGAPTLLNSLTNAPEMVKFGGFFLYLTACIVTICVISFVFKFLLKLVER